MSQPLLRPRLPSRRAAADPRLAAPTEERGLSPGTATPGRTRKGMSFPVRVSGRNLAHGDENVHNGAGKLVTERRRGVGWRGRKRAG